LVLFKAVDEIIVEFNLAGIWMKRFILLGAFMIDFAILNFIAIAITSIYLLLFYIKTQIHHLRGYYLKLSDFILPNINENVSLYINYKKSFFIIIVALIIIYEITALWKYKNVF
jgi:hypothetical protein